MARNTEEGFKCEGCDRTFQASEVAPYQRNADGTFSQACRYCITEWIKLHILWADYPFWARKLGMDR